MRRVFTVKIISDGKKSTVPSTQELFDTIREALNDGYDAGSRVKIESSTEADADLDDINSAYDDDDNDE